MIEPLERCPGCGAQFPPDGPGHPYIGASPGCWSVYGDVLAKEYGKYGLPPVHRLTVDTYAAQHPGAPSPRSIQSVAVSLVGLYVILERGFELHKASRVTTEAAAYRTRYRWLEPPDLTACLNILDIAAAETLPRHEDRVWEWARSVWDAWMPHHQTIKGWANLVLSRG
ncbi:MAG: DUF5946 family protein [Gemmatimonadota bacterium]|jgi:hypothetical protein